MPLGSVDRAVSKVSTHAVAFVVRGTKRVTAVGTGPFMWQEQPFGASGGVIVVSGVSRTTVGLPT